jgi:hydrogenase-4 component B
MNASEISRGLLVLFFVFSGTGVVFCSLNRSKSSLRVISIGSTLCSLAMMGAASRALIFGQPLEIRLWTLEGFGALSLRLDALSSVFLFISGLVYLPASLFVRRFLQTRFHGHYPIRRFGVLHFALMASVVLILIAHDAYSFLISWECMSILCYLMVNYEQTERSDSRAGYIMLAMSEAGFLAIVLAFLILGRFSADFSFPALAAAASQLSIPAMWGVFLLGLLGFGVKAGLVPVNFWLPRCYTAAPSFFVPILAGVTLNLGFYGILRLNADIAPGRGLGPGLVALGIGSVTALVGILYATTENDLKTMLAHSSIENAGIIVAGIGASLVFRASGFAAAAAIALTAALYHVANHSVYKALLFQGAGDIEAATGTRQMDELGGLARVASGLSVVFLVGCLAISAVPPFNGFVSEWLTLQSLLRSSLLVSPVVRIWFALCGAALALTAALAVTCFVKTYAMSFLGVQRGSWKVRASESARRPGLPSVYLAVACLLLGVLPTFVIPVLDRAVEPIVGASATSSLVPPFFTATPSNGQLPAAFLEDFHNLGAQSGSSVVPGRGLVVLVRGAAVNPVVFAMSPFYSLVALVIFLIVTWLVVSWVAGKRSMRRSELWAGGIPRLLPEMSYTATGFSNPVRVVFQAIFRPNMTEDTRQMVGVHFRTAIHRNRDETHLMDRLFLHPIGDAVVWFAKFLARMHHGRLNAYVAYVLCFFLIILLLYRFS